MAATRSMKKASKASALRSYRKRVRKSVCRKIKRSAACKRTTGCKQTKASTKRKSYCRKNKNTRRVKRV